MVTKMWFFKGTKNKKNIDQRIEKLEKLIEELSEKTFEYHINIEKLDIHNPKLDELTFQLDTIDVEELSGALNVGNNFGIQVHQKDKNKALKSKHKSELAGSDDQKKEETARSEGFTMNQNRSGFHIKLNRK